MEVSKLITEIIFKKPIDAKSFDRTMYFDTHHVQDCCESVYGDYQHFEIQDQEIKSLGEISKIEFMTAPGDGFIVNLYGTGEDEFGFEDRASVFVACRNSQNGYYNDSLDLIVYRYSDDDAVKEVYNLNEINCVLYDID